jgi:hypothetical protein
LAKFKRAFAAADACFYRPAVGCPTSLAGYCIDVHIVLSWGALIAVQRPLKVEKPEISEDAGAFPGHSF